MVTNATGSSTTPSASVLVVFNPGSQQTLPAPETATGSTTQPGYGAWNLDGQVYELQSDQSTKGAQICEAYINANKDGSVGSYGLYDSAAKSAKYKCTITGGNGSYASPLKVKVSNI